MKKHFLFLIMFFSLAVGQAQDWSLTGNAGTTPLTNFIGTTDTQNLVIKVNNVFSGIIDISNSNACWGYGSLSSNTTGTNNTAHGANALLLNRTGYNNTAMGASCLTNNTTGTFNTAYGTYALMSNLTGHHNVSTGYISLGSNTFGANNVAYGNNTLFSNIGGANNVAIGNAALLFFRNNSSYGGNVALGNDVLFNTTTGTTNTGIGAYSLTTNITGTANTAIGYYSDVLADNLTNANAIGTSTLATASNQVRIGNSSITSIGGYVGWTNISDGRVKTNIQTNVPGLSFINKLNPVTYNLDLAAAERILGYIPPVNKGGDKPLPVEGLTEARSEKEKIVYTGFIAQEVLETAKSLQYDFSGVDAPKNDKDLYGLRYAEFVVPLVKAVQELSFENDKKNSAIDSLSHHVSQLQKQINSIITQLNKCCPTSLSSSTEDHVQVNSTPEKDEQSSFLEQSFPNPSSSETTIRYYVSPQVKSSKILITDANGHPVKTIILNARGSGATSIKSAQLAHGTYFYSLVNDGNKVDTKTMLVF